MENPYLVVPMSNNYINSIINRSKCKLDLFNANITLANAKIEVIKALFAVNINKEETVQSSLMTLESPKSPNETIQSKKHIVHLLSETKTVQDAFVILTNAMSADVNIANAETIVTNANNSLENAKIMLIRTSLAMHLANVKKIDNISVVTGMELKKATLNIFDNDEFVITGNGNLSISSISSMVMTQAFIDASINKAIAQVKLSAANIALAHAKIEAITVFFAARTDIEENAMCHSEDAIAAFADAMIVNEKITIAEAMIADAKNDFEYTKVKLKDVSIALKKTDIEKSNGISINIEMAIAISIILNKASNNIFYENNDEDEEDDDDDDDEEDNDDDNDDDEVVEEEVEEVVEEEVEESKSEEAMVVENI